MNVVKGLHLGIDASNLRQGGALTHLSQLLLAADPRAVGIEQVTIWAAPITADCLPEVDWLHKRCLSWLNAPYPRRVLGQLIQIPREIKRAGCDVLFAPGGILSPIQPVPTITMSQNLLPFEAKEAARFGLLSKMYWKFVVLKWMQSRSFQLAGGVIFLTDYAKKTVLSTLRTPPKFIAMIPHGIESRFLQMSRFKHQKALNAYSESSPMKLLYVSILMPYKHQIAVAHAVYQLKQEGFPIEISFVGAAWGSYGQQFLKLIRALDPQQTFMHWLGEQSFNRVHQYYLGADIFVFASSCENLPNILIEAMAAGLPIACSDKGPMPEVLGDAGVYFNPESSLSIADALRSLIVDPDARKKMGALAQESVGDYSWKNCAEATFKFIANVALNG